MIKDEITILNKYRLPIMGFASLYILFFHTGIIVGDENNLFYQILFFVRRIGFLGVDIFLFLSGIGLVYSYENGKKKLWDFWKKRIRRILIPMLIMAVCYCITEHWSIKEFLQNITGYHFYAVEMERSFLWFYFMIAAFYFIFPLYYKFFDLSPNKYIYSAMVLCIWFAVSYAAQGHIRDDVYWMTSRIPVFLTGILLGWRMQNEKLEVRDYLYCIMTAILAMVLYMEYVVLIQNRPIFGLAGGFIYGYLAGITFTFLLAKLFSAFDCDKTGIGRILLKILSFFGIISYELYCVQEWIFGIMVDAFLGKTSIIILDILIFVVCVGAGLVVYWMNQRFWQGYQYIFSKKD